MALIEAMSAVAIVALNFEAVQTFGGTHGILQEGCPERCTKNAEMAEYYEGNGEAEELGLTYISALMYYLIENHLLCRWKQADRFGCWAASSL